MSQADLARGSGVSQAQISLIEGGERLNPGVLTLNAIAAALNVDIRDLLETKPRRRSKRSA